MSTTAAPSTVFISFAGSLNLILDEEKKQQGLFSFDIEYDFGALISVFKESKEAKRVRKRKQSEGE